MGHSDGWGGHSSPFAMWNLLDKKTYVFLEGKEPIVFWLEDCGTITKETYCEHTVPVI